MSELTLRYPEIHPVFQRESASCRRLVHTRPDELAEAVPEYVLFSYARTANPRDEFVDITARCFANAVNRASWYLSDELGKPEDFDSVGYYGTKRSGCGIFLLASGVSTQVQPILDKRPMRTFTVPELDWFLNEAPIKPYPYTKTFEEARNDPCVILHTTGSTGLPKPVVWKNAMLSTYEAWRTIPAIDGYLPPARDLPDGPAGLHVSADVPYKRAQRSPHLGSFSGSHAGIHRYADVEGSMGAPSLYEDLCAHPKMLVHMRHLHYVVASGAPLSRAAGDQISKYSRVINNLGATETACLPRLCPSMADWQYFYWHPTHSGIQMREHVESLYELVIVRDPKLEAFQGVFYAYPELDEWPMNDLYDRHPTKPFLWRYRGRKDHVIVFSNGEKVVPVLMEAALTSSPMVKGAMVVGHRRFQPLALLELADGQSPPGDEHERNHLIQELSPFIDEANAFAPAHAQLDHHHIFFAEPSRPIHYLGQGKIQRHMTFNMYKDDITAAYEAIEKKTGPKPSSLIEVAGKDLDPDDDLFKAGVDSLHVMKLSREIGGISPSSIYRHPTIRLLASFLVDAASDQGYERSDSTDSVDKMESLLRLYTAALPRQLQKETPTVDDDYCMESSREARMHVVLTGSTGSLGSYLLDTLYQNPAEARQRAISASRGLACDWDASRVTFLQADLSAPLLGLYPAVYHRLQAETTHVLHNQWPVNFHWPIACFEPHVRGVRNLVDLCFASRHDALLLFVSSVSAVGAWAGAEDTGRPLPEAPVRDLNAAVMGYGQAKLVSEQVLERAVETSGLRAAVCRIGVVAGPVQRVEGLWTRHEYIPALINSSAYLGLLPEEFPGRDIVDWLPHSPIPVNAHMQVFHVSNPRHIAWAAFVEYLCTNITLPKATFAAWLERLEDSSRESLQDVEKNPAAKLTEFYRRISERNRQPIMETSRAEAASETLRAVGAVNAEWVARWVRQWGLAKTE
ncbi:hypothetical protein PG997_008040 [Apiospora hydei]|uniref:Polyketide synthase-like phosphopantetheine-binding domain-containing protein n=1 Tax=Apiospora hydei TaxID=1337664 RepID=A0ABR1W9R8_9PEZI